MKRNSGTSSSTEETAKPLHSAREAAARAASVRRARALVIAARDVLIRDTNDSETLSDSGVCVRGRSVRLSLPISLFPSLYRYVLCPCLFPYRSGSI
jgi:hypothetical protein